MTIEANKIIPYNHVLYNNARNTSSNPLFTA